VSVFNFWLKELNQESFRKYRKYTVILGFSSLALKLVTEFPFFEMVFLGISVFLIIVSFKALNNEKFRPNILNGNNEFENTKYILYFLIYTGISGFLLVSWYLICLFASKI
jgi:hypothetical protein